jgi:RNA polymerase sigma-70 factor, ECF subfamily
MFRNSYGGHDAELVHIAKHLASGLIGTAGYTEHDADDLLQTLILAGTLAMPRFERSKAKRSTFIYDVLRKKVIDLIRSAARAKRDKSRETISLEEAWEGDESGETAWAELISAEHTLNNDGVARRDRKDPRPLRMDVEEALADLPPDLRELCRLHSYLRPEEARREAGMAKSTHHRAVAKIREFMANRGLRPSGTD